MVVCSEIHCSQQGLALLKMQQPPKIVQSPRVRLNKNILNPMAMIISVSIDLLEIGTLFPLFMVIWLVGLIDYCYITESTVPSEYSSSNNVEQLDR
ncbi:protease HtpX-like protein isoform X2 [Gossypium australe]|uniref:Protease HtpX-like protein isoform X2 n=1 Tax=Gossypium australe TaxID=47621 RepID=A0A5B6W335_9ROSI|nr:protease HtpX-like protein isoform X2 [Gossypium australe]